MLFVVYGKYRKKPTKEIVAQTAKLFEHMAKEGITFKAMYWTLGRYDITAMAEAKDEKTFMKAILRFGDIISSETAIAVPREEAVKLVE
jgi:uncharacterized protein with GYD domain